MSFALVPFNDEAAVRAAHDADKAARLERQAEDMSDRQQRAQAARRESKLREMLNG